jgi:hypothetical protein
MLHANVHGSLHGDRFSSGNHSVLNLEFRREKDPCTGESVWVQRYGSFFFSFFFFPFKLCSNDE